MRKYFCILALLCGFAVPAHAQATASLTAQDSGACTTANACLVVNLNANQASSVVQLTGTFSATLQFEGTNTVGGTFVAVNAVPVGGTTAVTSATSTGAWRIAVAGLLQVRVRCSTYSSGTVVAAITASTGSSANNTSGGGGGAVSSVFTRTGAVVAAANDYTLDQVGDPAAAKTFSLSTHFPFGTTAPGVFTNTIQNDFNVFTLTGGSSCSPSNIYTSGAVNTTNKNTDALTGCASTPSSGTTNGFSVGVAGLAQANDNGTGGVFGWDGVVGIFGGSLCAVSNAHCWGGNFAASDLAGHTGNQLIGEETDVFQTIAGTTGYGHFLAMQGTAQSVNDTFPGYFVSFANSTSKFTSGFECASGSMSSGGAFACFNARKQAAAGVSGSLFNFWTANDGSADFASALGLSAGHVFTFSASSPVAGGGFATYLTSTATLSVHQLVKIDTSNADSVVICTTSDTSCDGVVGESVVQGCQAGGTACPIITVPGSKVQMILGTGTCSIGNFVIVDTTTNGRVKCTGTPPTIGNEIGKALSAQSSVGSLVDVLTKFE